MLKGVAGEIRSMVTASARQKRAHKRFQKSCKVEFCVYNETLQGISEDFSVDGLLIRTDHPPFWGSVVSVTVYLPDGSTSQLKGKVRRVLTEKSDSFMGAARTFRGGMGIEIIERDSNYLKFLMSLLSTSKL
jgi:hypothetical protein